MKKNLFATIILCMMATLSTKAQVYVLDDAAERSFNTIGSTEYSLDGRPAGQLTFEAKCEDIFWVWGGDLYIQQYVNNQWIEIGIATFPKKDIYYNFGPFDLDKAATKIKLYTEGGATGRKKCVT